MTLDTFTTGRLRAERLAPHHFDELCRMHRDAAVMAELGGVKSPAETEAYLARNLAHWQQHGFGLWIVYPRDGAEPIGRAVLRHLALDAPRDSADPATHVGQGFSSPAARSPAHVGQGFSPAARTPAHVGQGFSPAARTPAHVGQGFSPAARTPAYVGQGFSPAARTPAHVGQGFSPAARTPAHVGQGFSPAVDVEVGYAFYSPWWGRGLATEVTLACLRLGFDRLGRDSIVAVTSPGNTASQQVLRKCGLMFERKVTVGGSPMSLFRTVAIPSPASSSRR